MDLLAAASRAVYHNVNDVCFDISVNEKGRPKKHHVVMRCRRYRASNNECDVECFEVCEHQSETLLDLLSRALRQCDMLSWCTSCCTLTLSSIGGRCLSCSLYALASSRTSRFCVICQEDRQTTVMLDCSHIICFRCARQLSSEDDNDVVCPCCRHPHCRWTLDLKLPPSCINLHEAIKRASK